MNLFVVYLKTVFISLVSTKNPGFISYIFKHVHLTKEQQTFTVYRMTFHIVTSITERSQTIGYPSRCSACVKAAQ